ncbi:MAG: glutaredoxin 3 [Methylococcales bacterium]
MPKITIYSKTLCPYCSMAKRLLASKGAQFKEIFVDRNPEHRQEMINKTKRMTVPQIFIKDFHVGGFDDLHALERAGKLDPLLAEASI